MKITYNHLLTQQKNRTIFETVIMTGVSEGQEEKIKMILNDKKYKFNSNEGVSVVNFYVDWCFYSKIQKLILNKFHNTIGSKVRIYNIDSDKNKLLVEKLQVESFPSILIFKNGNMVSHLKGLQDNDTLVTTVNQFIL